MVCNCCWNNLGFSTNGSFNKFVFCLSSAVTIFLAFYLWYAVRVTYTHPPTPYFLIVVVLKRQLESDFLKVTIPYWDVFPIACGLKLIFPAWLIILNSYEAFLSCASFSISVYVLIFWFYTVFSFKTLKWNVTTPVSGVINPLQKERI